MSDRYDYGPLKTFEITWTSGHVERIAAHQVSWPGNAFSLSSLAFGQAGPEPKRRVQFHADLDGKWTLQLSALEDDIRTIRNVATEDIPVASSPETTVPTDT
jgi:hypothetical protein